MMKSTGSTQVSKLKTLLLSVAALPPAFAAAQTDTQDGESDRLGEVVVTATKREQALQSVPVTVSALDANAVAKMHADDLTAISAIIPNVQMSNFLSFPTGSAFYIRGIGATNVINTVDPAVATFVDGVYIAGIGVGIPDLFDVERIEVLRGPQGTLFGRNTTAGAVQIRSRRPSSELHYEGHASFGSHGRQDYRASLEGPLGERAAARVSAMRLTSDGYFTDSASGKDFGGQDVLGLRAALTFNPSSNFDVALLLDYTKDESDQFGATCVAAPTDPALHVAFGGACYPVLNGDGSEFTVDQNTIPYVDNESWGIALEANWDVSGLGIITSITGYRDHSLYNWSDTDFSFADLNNQWRADEFEQFTQELRLASTFSERFDFVAGVFYLDATSDATQYIEGILPDANFILDFMIAGTPFAHAPYNPNAYGGLLSVQDQQSFAVFTETNLHVTDSLTLTAGLRYSWEEKEIRFAPFVPIGFGGCDPLVGFSSCPALLIEADESWDDVSPKVGFRYEVDRDLMFYGYYTRGFRSGGFNGQAGSAAGIGPFEPESVDSYELGMKSDWLDGRLRFNTALFTNEYKDLQRSVFLSPTNLMTLNAADATIQGIEIEAIGLLTDYLRLEASLGLLDASYDSFLADIDGNGSVTDNSGLNLQYAPETSYRVAMAYDRPLSNGVNLGFDVEYVFTAELDTHSGNDPRARRDDLGLVNANLSLRQSDRGWGVSLFARNLTDELYIKNGEIAYPQSVFRVPGDPRSWGVQFTFSH